jgi:hypothetical protein
VFVLDFEMDWVGGVVEEALRRGSRTALESLTKAVGEMRGEGARLEEGQVRV